VALRKPHRSRQRVGALAGIGALRGQPQQSLEALALCLGEGRRDDGPPEKRTTASSAFDAPNRILSKPSLTNGQSARQRRESAMLCHSYSPRRGGDPESETSMSEIRQAKFQIGQIVKHRVYPFRGVIFDVDPTFSNTEEWYQSIPEEVRPRKDQPFYHLLAENAETTYIAYVSEQNLLVDESGRPIKHPSVGEMFTRIENGRYLPKARVAN
jgi:heat shock protein HspQ